MTGTAKSCTDQNGDRRQAFADTQKMVSANTCLLNAVNLSQYMSDEIYLTNLTVKFVVVRL